mmetsp:Transcript_8820/g.22839  ORF Transcript_8820/g.22839 Transcript_8820/m.22839 type:complete len:262 (+) Transcript_8820:4704-5489(+)
MASIVRAPRPARARRVVCAMHRPRAQAASRATADTRLLPHCPPRLPLRVCARHASCARVCVCARLCSGSHVLGGGAQRVGPLGRAASGRGAHVHARRRALRARVQVQVAHVHRVHRGRVASAVVLHRRVARHLAGVQGAVRAAPGLRLPRTLHVGRSQAAQRLGDLWHRAARAAHPRRHRRRRLPRPPPAVRPPDRAPGWPRRARRVRGPRREARRAVPGAGPQPRGALQQQRQRAREQLPAARRRRRWRRRVQARVPRRR